MRPAAALFAKSPIPGRVKTRLQPDLSPELSASLHRAFVADMWEKLEALGGAVDPVLYSNSERPSFTTPSPTVPIYLQRGADLGDKMRHCFAELHAAGRPAALILGTDSPTLPARIIREALEALDRTDAVLTPVDDGGYCLIGVREPHPAMFRGVSWSTPRTLVDTEEALRRCGYGVRKTEGWYDVDHASDLRRLCSDPAVPRHTAAWLEQHYKM